MFVSACGGSSIDADNQPLLEVRMEDIQPGKTICVDEPALMFRVILANLSDTDMNIQELYFRRTGSGNAEDYGFWGFNGAIIREGVVNADSVTFPMAPFVVPAGASKSLQFWIQAHASDATGEHVFSLTDEDTVHSVPDARVDGAFPLRGNPVMVSTVPCQ